jgi:hypothetical protein
MGGPALNNEGFTVVASTPLSELVRSRSSELGLTFEELGYRLGYSNPSKAAGRLKALCDGVIDSHKSQQALLRLHNALNLPFEEVDRAIQETRGVLAQRHRLKLDAMARQWRVEDEAFRASFKPHGVLLGSETRPSQITIFAWTGGPERWLIIRPDLDQPPVTFIGQIVQILSVRVPKHASGKRYTPFFGEALGFVMNFTPDQAVRCTMDGEPVEILEEAYLTGYSYAAIGSRKLSAEEARTLVLGGGHVD